MRAYDILGQLNKAIKETDPDLSLVRKLLTELTQQEGLKLKVLDFEFYDEASLKEVEKAKYFALRRQSYEEAAQWRDKVLEIQKYIDLRNDLKLTSSTFRIDHGHLFYFHTGKGENDSTIKTLLEEQGGQ